MIMNKRGNKKRGNKKVRVVRKFGFKHDHLGFNYRPFGFIRLKRK